MSAPDFENGPARAAVGTFPYPHKTVAQIERMAMSYAEAGIERRWRDRESVHPTTKRRRAA